MSEASQDGAALAPKLEALVTAARDGGRQPLAILDVDMTLLDNAPRNRAIWCDWLHSVRDRWDAAESAMVRAQTMEMVYDVRDNLRGLGVSEPALVAEGLKHWIKAFFTSRYARFDVPLPGAVEAVTRLRAAGITVVYLTARPTSMIEGTVKRFSEVGLPVGAMGTVLVMKDDRSEGDVPFKRRALGWIGALGTPVLAADNEPGHVNAMHEAFPGALTVHVDTRHSKRSPPLADGPIRCDGLLEAVVPRP